MRATLLLWALLEAAHAYLSTGSLDLPFLSAAHNNRSYREQLVVKELLKNYSSAVRPKGKPKFFPNGTIHSSPIHISVTVWLLSLSSFNDVTMEFTAQLNFQQEWTDERLKVTDESFGAQDYISLSLDQETWKPDTFFQNEQEGHTHSIDQPNEFIKLKNNGMILYKKRLTMAFSCPMNLMLFPHDNQTCVIEFSSYAYTTKDIVFVWSDRSVIFSPNADDSLPKFAINYVGNESCNSITATGEYSCLRIRLVLQREFSFFLMQLYIPSCLLVSVSCVSFWIDWRSAPARVPLTIITLLTVTTQANGINSSLPPVSYTKAIDIWINGCTVFVFGALIEYAIVNYVGTNEEKSKAKQARRRRNIPQTQQRVPIKSQSLEPSLLAQATTLYPNLREMSDENIGPWVGLRQWRRRRFRPVLSYMTMAQQQANAIQEEDCYDSQDYVDYRRKMMISTQGPDGGPESLMVGGGAGDPFTRAERIDIMARILFPIGFVCFNIVYWSLYLPSSAI